MSDIIEIIESVNQIVVVDDGVTSIIEVPATSLQILEVSAQGPQGIPGPASAAISFTHTQSTAATEWVVNHNLGVYPLAEVRSVGGVVVEAEVLHISLNQFKVFFDVAYSGVVRCL